MAKPHPGYGSEVKQEYEDWWDSVAALITARRPECNLANKSGKCLQFLVFWHGRAHGGGVDNKSDWETADCLASCDCECETCKMGYLIRK